MMRKRTKQTEIPPRLPYELSNHNTKTIIEGRNEISEFSKNIATICEKKNLEFKRIGTRRRCGGIGKSSISGGSEDEASGEKGGVDGKSELVVRVSEGGAISPYQRHH